MTTDTPRTDEFMDGMFKIHEKLTLRVPLHEFARQLERELAELRKHAAMQTEDALAALREELASREREAAEDDLIELADTEWWMESMREEFSENAPWLSAAHALCTDAGIPQGHITERIEALRGLVESLRKDAERYRWLRHGCDKKQSTATRIAQCLYGMEWDAAIDAAMANIDPPGGE